MPEVVVLGSGTSSGVPTLVRKYPPEFLANPKNHRTRPSIWVKGPTGALLVDAGPDLRFQLLREGIDEIDAVLITHTHADHIMGMDDLRTFCLFRGSSLPVYALPQYQLDIRRVFDYAFKEFPPGIEVPRFELRDVPDVLEVGGMTIRTFTVEHGPLPCTALRIGDFAYVTDVKRIPPASETYLEGLETLILDCTRYEPHRNHLNLEEALAVVERFKPKQTYFTHLCHDFDHDPFEASLPAGVKPAFDGLRLNIA